MLLAVTVGVPWAIYRAYHPSALEAMQAIRQSSQNKADIRMAKIEIGALRAALESYAADVKSFPTTEQGLAALVEKPADSDDTKTWEGPYLSGELPKDPWGHEFQYQYPPTRSQSDKPDIWSMGPDGEDNTDDDIWLDKGSEDGTSRDAGTVQDKSGTRSARNSSATSSRTSGSKMPGTTRSGRSSDRKSSTAPSRSSRRTDDGR